MNFIKIIIIFLFVSCTSYYKQVHSNITNYKITPNVSTPAGVRVDVGSYNIDLQKLDRYIIELELCIETTINIYAITVKFPDDIYISRCTGAELFPCKTSPSICKRKINNGQFKLLMNSPCEVSELPCDECPCHCQGAIQNNWAIITTPNMLTFKAELARLVLGISNPWSVEQTKHCL